MSEGTGIITPTHDPYAAALASAVLCQMYDVDGETIGVRHVQDVEAILDANKHDHNHVSGYSPSRDLKHVARIPNVVALIWLNQYGVDVLNKDHKTAVARLLNSNEWRHLRTGGGRL